MTDPVNLNARRAKQAHDNRLVSVRDMLEYAITDINEGREDPQMGLVLTWTEDGDDFSTYWYASNLKSSEMIALMEMVKAQLLRDMGLT